MADEFAFQTEPPTTFTEATTSSTMDPETSTLILESTSIILESLSTVLDGSSVETSMSSVLVESATQELTTIAPDSNSTNILDFFTSSGESTTNGTDTGNGEAGALHDWQVILIATLSAGAVVIIAVFIVLWKFCSRKPNITNIQTRNVTPGPASSAMDGHNAHGLLSKGSCCLCFSSLAGTNRKSSSGMRDMARGSGENGENSDKEPYPGQQSTAMRALDARQPLPPIGDADVPSGMRLPLSFNDPLALGRAHMMPRRLAPLTEHSKVMATNLAGGTVVHHHHPRAGAYGPVQLNTDLRSPPAVMTEQRRAFPPPPPVDSGYKY